MSPSEIHRIRRSLLRWYRRNRRDLPWRRTDDPYAIWIAETMLQQTQVKTVVPYYGRFLKALPTVRHLDKASTERVLALWSGLGYYRRALNLKRAARMILLEHGRKLPADFKALRSLPGVGLYTAGALMSIAFNQPYPALDGNARRVLQRLSGARDVETIGEIAERLVSGPPPREWNQALMELGARVCLPREPNCALCPLAAVCSLKKLGPSALSKRQGATPKVRQVEWALALIRENGKILLHRRPEGGLLGGLWEIPGGERKKRETLAAAIARQLAPLGAAAKLGTIIGEIRHSITYRSIRAYLYRCAITKPLRLPDRAWAWVDPRSLRRRPVSALSRKAVKLLQQSMR